MAGISDSNQSRLLSPALTKKGGYINIPSMVTILRSCVAVDCIPPHPCSAPEQLLRSSRAVLGARLAGRCFQTCPFPGHLLPVGAGRSSLSSNQLWLRLICGVLIRIRVLIKTDISETTSEEAPCSLKAHHGGRRSLPHDRRWQRTHCSVSLPGVGIALDRAASVRTGT